MRPVLDFLADDNAVALERSAKRALRTEAPAIRALSRAYRAFLLEVAEATFTPATVTRVSELKGLPGGPARALCAALLDSATEIAPPAFSPSSDEAAGKEVVSLVETMAPQPLSGIPVPQPSVGLRRRSASQMAESEHGVDRAADALRAAASRFDRAHPLLSAQTRQALIADKRAAYEELLRLAPSAISRRALAGMLAALGRTARSHAKTSAAAVATA